MYYYKQVKDDKIVSVEAKTLDATSQNFAKATKAEYDNFIASLPVIEPEAPRDLAAEIDEIKAEITSLKREEVKWRLMSRKSRREYRRKWRD